MRSVEENGYTLLGNIVFFSVANILKLTEKYIVSLILLIYQIIYVINVYEIGFKFETFCMKFIVFR